MKHTLFWHEILDIFLKVLFFLSKTYSNIWDPFPNKCTTKKQILPKVGTCSITKWGALRMVASPTAYGADQKI